MGTTNYADVKAAREALRRVFERANTAQIIHYSCESFYDRPNGASPRITSIAVRQIDSGQTSSFSIHQVAERHHANLAQLENEYDRFEREMLDDYFAFVARHPRHLWVHWNMRDINFGFSAIEHRYRVLGGNPVVVGDDNKIDLASILIDLFGPNYIGHPRLQRLIEKNDISKLAFMVGEEEAAAFEARNYVALHQSTLRKVDIMANILNRVRNGTLKTNASWWTRNGSSVRGVADWIAAHPLYILFALVAGGASIGGLYLAL